jgi:hypothetical protein
LRTAACNRPTVFAAAAKLNPVARAPSCSGPGVAKRLVPPGVAGGLGAKVMSVGIGVLGSGAGLSWGALIVGCGLVAVDQPRLGAAFTTCPDVSPLLWTL